MWDFYYKDDHWRIDAFELWCWKRLLRVPWTARRSNQSNLKEISPEYSLEGLMLKLKLQYFGHMSQRNDSLKKTLMLWKIEGRRRRGWQRMRWYQLNGRELGQTLGHRRDRETWCVTLHGVAKSRSVWITTTIWEDQLREVIFLLALDLQQDFDSWMCASGVASREGKISRGGENAYYIWWPW